MDVPRKPNGLYGWLDKQKQKKAARTTKTLQQKRILWGANALTVAIMGLGLWFQVFYTATAISVLVVSLASLWVRWSVGHLVGQVVFFPPVFFLLAAYTWGFAQGISEETYDLALQQDAEWTAAEPFVTKQVALFADTYAKGKTEVLGEVPMDKMLWIGAQDVWGYRYVDMVMDAALVRAPSHLNTSQILPLADVFYADRTVVLWNMKVMDQQQKINAEMLAQKLGKSTEDLTQEDWAAHADTLPDSILSLTCSVKNDGTVVGVSSFPSGRYIDLLDYKAAAPLVAVCADVARGGDSKLPKVHPDGYTEQES